MRGVEWVCGVALHLGLAALAFAVWVMFGGLLLSLGSAVLVGLLVVVWLGTALFFGSRSASRRASR